MKSSVAEIRARFDGDVERFSDLETGQSATIDAPLSLELVTQTAAALSPGATDVLDVGCGAGNYTLKLLGLLPTLNATLVDLSAPMLERAVSRITPATSGAVTARQGDIRELQFEMQFDFILAGAVLHHLRDDEEWQATFAKFYDLLKPGGSIWIVDLIAHSDSLVQQLMWARYGEYLSDFKGDDYRQQVFDYIEKEDTPRPLMFQLDLLRAIGFGRVEVLHKNSVFAAFGAIK